MKFRLPIVTLPPLPVPPEATSGLHFCFNAPSRKSVDAFHAAALSHGGRDNGKPGVRADYGVALFLSGMATDYILEGPSVIRTCVIITNKPQEVSKAIFLELGRGVTSWQATGMYTGEERSILYVAVGRSQVQELRRVVEPAAVRMAAERATAQDLSDIEAAYEGMRKAVEEGGDYVTYDLRFHQGLLRACRNRMMVQMSKALSALLRTSFEISTTRTDGPKLSLPLHRAVLDAVAAQPAFTERAAVAEGAGRQPVHPARQRRGEGNLREGNRGRHPGGEGAARRRARRHGQGR